MHFHLAGTIGAVAFLCIGAAPAAAAGTPVPTTMRTTQTVLFEDRDSGTDRVSAMVLRVGPKGTEQFTLRVLRGATVLASATTTDLPFGQNLSVDIPGLAAGDVAQVVGQDSGIAYDAVTYDQRPLITDNLCSTYSEFAGTQASGAPPYWVGVRTGAPGSAYAQARNGKTARAKISPGATAEGFRASFKAPLTFGQFVTVRAMRRTDRLWVMTDIDRAVVPSLIMVPLAVTDTATKKAAECIAKVPSPSPIGPAAKVVVKKLPKRARSADLASKGVRFTVKSEVAGTVSASLVLAWTERLQTRRGKQKAERRRVIGTVKGPVKSKATTAFRIKVAKKHLATLRRVGRIRGATLRLATSAKTTAGRPISTRSAVRIKLPRQ